MPPRYTRPVPLDPVIAARIAECREKRGGELDLWGTRAASVPREILELTWLRRLNLPWNLRTLPPGIEALTELEHLRLGTVHRLPEALGRLSKLRLLLFNGPTRPPEGLRFVPQLRTLELIYSKTATPPDVAGLDQLETLLLHGGFRALPADIGALSALRTLDLDQNKLTELPAALGRLTRLERLDVCQNQLTTVPCGLGGLSQLHGLNLNWNRLEHLPEDLGPFPALRSLNVARNRLHTLPAALLRAPLLRNLELYDNPWVSLPDLSALHELEGSLSIGGVQTLPAGLASLTKISKLTLNTTPLEELPAEIFAMRNLEILTAARCGLQRIHPDIGKLAKLRHLDLRDNRLTALPATMVALPLGQNADDSDDDDSAYCHTPGLQLDGNPVDPALFTMEPAEQIAALSRAG